MLAAVLLLPVVELVVALQVGRALGTGPTVLLVLAGCLLGALVLRRLGTDAVRALRRLDGRVDGRPDVRQGGRPHGRSPVDAALLVVAGLLLLVPGLVSDVLGLLLLLPPVRRLLRRAAGRAVERRLAAAGRRVVPGEAVQVEVLEVRDVPFDPPVRRPGDPPPGGATRM